MHKLYGISRRLFDTSNNEIIFKDGKGCYVYDTEGRKYIDLILGYGPAIMGHGNEKFADYIHKAILKGTVFPSYSAKQIELAERLNKYYSRHRLLAVYQSGSDSLMAALKICRKITGRKNYIRFGYVGWLDDLFIGGLNWHEPVNSVKYNESATKNAYNEYAFNWGGDDMSEIEKLCCMQDVACLIADAYQIDRHHGCDFDRVIELCKKNNILVVLDETKTAGRVTPYGYYKERYDFDLTVLGKAIGNGIPVSLLMISRKCQMDSFDSFKIAGTYTRDLLSCEAVLATEKIMTNIDGYNMVSETGKFLAKRLNQHLREINISDVYVNVLLDGGILELTFSEHLANDFKIREKLSDVLLQNQLIIPDGHCFYICTEHNKTLDEIENLFIKAFAEVFILQNNVNSKT